MNSKLRFEWYNRQDVQQQIIQHLAGSETCFLVPESMKGDGTGLYPVRCVKAHASGYLLSNMRAFDFFSRKYNLYHSIYSFQGMPMFSYKPLERREQQNAFFLNFDKYVTGVIFVMDFDGDKSLSVLDRVRQAKESLMKVLSILDHFTVPYNVVFSGTKGFHLEVRGFPMTRNWKKQTRIFGEIATRLTLVANGDGSGRDTPSGEDFNKHLLERFSFDTPKELRTHLLEKYHFDNSIYNVTRIWKCPYSYDVATDNIVMPLSEEQLNNFAIEEYAAQKLRNVNFWNRGLLKRPGTIHDFWVMADYLGVEYENQL